MKLQSLLDNFHPEDLLFRKEQSEIIDKVFTGYEDGADSMATNLILIGVTGVGKTYTLKKVAEQHPDHIYISASTKKKSNQIISLISGVNVRRTDVLLEKTIEFLKNNKKVLIIDELNRIEDARAFFDDLNTIYRETSTPIILITNNPLVLNQMEDDAKNTLFFKKIIFKKYNALELKDICLQRINLLPFDLSEKMFEGTLGYICALAGQIGSARKALNLIRGCYSDDKFDIKHVAHLIEQEEFMDFETYINSINLIQRKFLESMVMINRDMYVAGKDYFTSKEIHECLPELNISKISQLITIFEEHYGFIKTKYEEKGRGGGRFRKINFVDKNTIDQLNLIFLEGGST